MGIFKKFDRKKWLYNGLIGTFIILYAVTAFVSFYHAITFFNIANAIWLSVLLSFVAEIGQASVLFGILLTENKSKFLPWVIMFILTTLQVIGNVVSSFDWIIAHNDAGLDGFKRSILFFVQTEDSEMFRVIIAWISGALLPVIALSMTALVAQNIELRDDEKKVKNIPEFTGSTIPQEVIIDAKDIISEVSRIRPTEEDIENMEKFLKGKIPINKVPTEEEELIEKKDEWRVKDDKLHPDHQKFIDELSKKNESEVQPPDVIVPIDEPEELYEPDEDELGPVDLTNEIPDEISQEDIKKVQEFVSHIEDKSKEIDFLDEETKRLVPEIGISHKNGLVDGLVEGITDPLKIEESPPLQIEKIEEPPIEVTPDIKQEPEVSSSIPSSHPTPEQLERIRRMAKDNLKKK
jgi:hypothetical protein